MTVAFYSSQGNDPAERSVQTLKAVFIKDGGVQLGTCLSASCQIIIL